MKSVASSPAVIMLHSLKAFSLLQQSGLKIGINTYRVQVIIYVFMSYKMCDGSVLVVVCTAAVCQAV